MDWHRIFRHPRLAALGLCAACYAHALGPQKLTAVPKGPIHAERNQLVDSQGHAFLIRGTQLPELRTPAQVHRTELPAEFHPHSATVFSTIRQRWNMNAVRLPLNLSDYERDPQYLQDAGEVVRRANQLELVVILAAHDPVASLPPENLIRFWRRCSAFFRDHPEVIFELDAGDSAGTRELINAVRASGAKQPVLIGGRQNPVDDVNAIYTVYPRYKTTRTDLDRDRQFGELAERVPVLAGNLDPELDVNSEECASLSGDPSEAEALVQANLDYFDAHGISWVASEFRAGKLIRDNQDLSATSLESGWVCGRPGLVPSGIGEMVKFHLWGGELRGLFAVNAAGNFMLPRGGVAIVYGGIFAEKDTRNNRTPPATELGKVSVRITDHAGVTRRAGLLYVAAGWGQANFIVPAGCSLGPARVTVERRDGTHASTPVTIVDVAPGFWTASLEGRGPVTGFVIRAAPGLTPARVPISRVPISRVPISRIPISRIPIYRCDSQSCFTIAVPVSGRSLTTVQLLGTGFRNAAGLSSIQVKIGGMRVPVLSFGPTGDAGVDQLTVRIPSSLRATGETDLVCSIQKRLSNVVRINIGSVER